MARKSTLIVAVLIIAILIAGGFAMVGEVYADTTGHSYYYKGWKGNSIEAGAPHDLLDATEYVTSWDSRGMSEKIFLYAYVWPSGWPAGDGPGGCVLNDYWWVLTVEGGGAATWDYWGQRVTTTQFVTAHHWPSGQPGWEAEWIDLETDMVKIVGPYVGKIRCEFWANHEWRPYPWQVKRATTMFASDEAYLRSGSGSVTVPTYVEEGTTGILKVNTGYSGNHGLREDTGTQGWLLRIFDAQGRMVKETTIPDKSNGYEVKFTVPLGSFDPTPGVNNNWKVELWNMLFVQHQEYIVVIKIGTAQQLPKAPTIISKNGNPPWSAGTILEWRLEAEKNPVGYDIAGFRISVQYSPTAGQLQDYIIENQYYAAVKSTTKNNTWTLDWSVVAPQTGFYVISAQTIDVQNNPSAFTKLEYEVGPGGGMGPGKAGTWDWKALLIGIIAIVAGLVIGLLIILYAPPPYGLIIGILVIIVGITVGGWYLYGFITDAQDKGLLTIQQMLFNRR